MVVDFLDHIVREVGTGVVHGQDHAAHAQPREEGGLYTLDRLGQLTETFQSEIFTLDRNEHTILRCDQAVDRQQAQGGRAVDQDVIVFIVQRVERVSQSKLAARLVHQLHLRACQCRGGRQKRKLQPLIEKNEPGRRILVDDGLIGAALDTMFVDTQAGCRICLRVEVYDQNMLAQLRKISCEVDGSGSLANTALLIDESVDAGHWIFDF